MIILPVLTASLVHLFLKGWENVLSERGNWGVEENGVEEDGALSYHNVSIIKS